MGGRPDLQETSRLYRTMDNLVSATCDLTPNEGVRIVTIDHYGLPLCGGCSVKTGKVIRALYSFDDSLKYFWKLIGISVPMRATTHGKSSLKQMVYSDS